MKVAGYELGDTIGRGGASVVYRALDADGREVAVKLLGSGDASAMDRFERESRLLATLGEKDGFVPLLDAGSSPQGVYLVMPLVTGGTLKERLRGPLPIDETIALGRALASALGRAHVLGIVHRDLKPANVLFRIDGKREIPLIADLGIAKHFRRDLPGAAQSRSLSQTGTFTGTLGYAAPEQMRDAKSVGPAADVFSLGAILYECLAGVPAFRGGAGAILEIFMAQSVERSSFEALAPLRPDAPAWLVAVIERCLAREAMLRFPDGAAVAHALAAPSRSRRKRAIVALGALLLLAALSSSFFFVTRTPPGPKPAELAASAKAKALAGDVEGAIADATRAVELDPELALAWSTRGAARLDKGDPTGARADFDRALEIDEKDAETHVLRGLARRRKRDVKGALADMERAIELDPKKASAWEGRADARLERGEADGALADLEHALALDPKRPSAWSTLSYLRTEKGELDRAIEAGTHAIDLAPNLLSAWVNRAGARFRRGDLDGAIGDYTRAIELDSSRADSWDSRGDARLRKADWDGAIADEERAIALDAERAGAWFRIGCARGEKGELDRAETAFTRAIELDRQEPSFVGSRAVIRVRRGDKDGARADFLQCLELGPSDSDAARAREWLEKNR